MFNSGKDKILGFAAVMLMAAASAMAGEAAKDAPQDPSFLDQFLNWLLSLDPFSLALLLIVVSTIIGTLLKGRSRDRCYKMMAGFNVYLVLDDRKAQGVLAVGNAGIETTLDNPAEGPYVNGDPRDS